MLGHITSVPTSIDSKDTKNQNVVSYFAVDDAGRFLKHDDARSFQGLHRASSRVARTAPWYECSGMALHKVVVKSFEMFHIHTSKRAALDAVDVASKADMTFAITACLEHSLVTSSNALLDLLTLTLRPAKIVTGQRHHFFSYVQSDVDDVSY
jgi:hypothetical protein